MSSTKKSLICSVAANLAFCVVVVCSVARHKMEAGLQNGLVAPSYHEESEGQASAKWLSDAQSISGNTESKQSSPTVGAPFQWNQLESTDYRKYVSNLRAIGCPEQTIRDIIVADVHELFAKEDGRGQDIDWQLLTAQEVAVVTALLGPLTSEDKEKSEPAFTRLARRGSLQETNIVMPLVLQGLRSGMELTASQAEAMNWLRQEFETTLGSNRDPNDPGYLSRWEEAQRASDAMLRGLLGPEFYTRYRMRLTEEQGGTQ